LIPESFESRAVAQKDELVEALNRVRLLAQKSAPVKLLFDEGNLIMSAQSQDVGAAKESLLVQYEGESLEIGFNPEFLLAGAMSVPDEEVDMRFISPLRPGLLRGKDEDFLYLIMPIRLND
ncbi:MAG: DNA polymerase III subunit beta, partial [Actinobacteria bacterium]|nr:DNA polymerase III subunit beta [Actinomycetota bacterium]